MTMTSADHIHHTNEGSPPRPVVRWPLYVFLGVLAFYLFTQHREHLLGWLPYLIFLACPLMHFFHRGSHGGHTDTSPTVEVLAKSGGPL
ncbi:MAG: hypothetical protein GEEBNDBF_02706 [bacterium]|nr:hypothetical protein [bacterium]